MLRKLKNLQDPPERAHQVLLARFGQERFLYRVSTGVHRERFVLKGGLLLTAMTDQFYR